MGIAEVLKDSIGKMGVKEVARRSGLSPSTISRVGSGQINPSLEVVEKISKATGFLLTLQPDTTSLKAPRLDSAKNILSRLRNELKTYGVKHVIIFGSVARGNDRVDSDIDVYLDFGDIKVGVAKLLKAEGRIFEVFGENKVDVTSQLNSPKGQRLKQKIDQEGIRVF